MYMYMYMGQPVTPTHPDMRRVSWGQSAQTTAREVSFAILLAVTQSTAHRECSTIYIYIGECQ